MTALPQWLQPDTLVYHKPSRVLFVAARCAKKPNGSIVLIDAPKGHMGMEYPLGECQKPRLKHLQAGLIVYNNKAISVVQRGDLFILQSDSKRLGVRVSSVEAAAQSLANAFSGVIVQEEVSNGSYAT